jgi:hypothetical protein
MLNLAKVNIELRESADALSLLKRIVKFHPLDFPPHLRERAMDKLDQAKEMLRKLAAGEMSTEKQ